MNKLHKELQNEKNQEKTRLFSNIPRKYIKRILLFFGVPSLFASYVKEIPSYLGQEKRKVEIQRISQLTTFQNFGDILQAYHGDKNNEFKGVRQKTMLLFSNKAQYFDFKPKNKNSEEICGLFLEKILSKNSDYTSGAEIFSSNELSDFREIHLFYESLGVMIDNKAISFDLVFDLIFLPAKFNEDGTYDPTKNPVIEINDCLSRHWHGLDSANKENLLIDHGAAIKKLSFNYSRERQKLKNNVLPEMLNGDYCFFSFDHELTKRPDWLSAYKGDKSSFDLLFSPFHQIMSIFDKNKAKPCERSD